MLLTCLGGLMGLSYLGSARRQARSVVVSTLTFRITYVFWFSRSNVRNGPRVQDYGKIMLDESIKMSHPKQRTSYSR